MAGRRRNRSFSITAVSSSVRLLDEIVRRRSRFDEDNRKRSISCMLNGGHLYAARSSVSQNEVTVTQQPSQFNMAALLSSVNQSRAPSKTNISQTLKQERDGRNLVEEDPPVSFEEHPLTWKKFEEENITVLRQLTPPELESALAKLLDFEDYTLSITDGAKLDYFVGGFLFCSEQNFGFFQTSSFMGLLDKLINNCASEMTLEDNVSEFVSYLREMTSLKQGTSSLIECFNTKQAKKIIDFLHQGIFQHYNLYRYMFECEQKEETLQEVLEIEVIPPDDVLFPPPLHEGIPLELYDKYVAPSAMTASEDTRSENLAEAAAADGMEATGLSSATPKSKQANAAELILNSLKPEEIKDLVEKITAETLQNIKMETDSKIKEREAAMTAKLNKLHLT